MTVIAYDKARGQIAVDSRMSAGQHKHRDVVKYIWTADGKLVLFCGQWSEVLTLKRMVLNNEELEKGELQNCTMIVVDKGKVFEYDGPDGEEIKENYAWGSGMEYAFGALAAGATATDSVKIAAKYNLSCGGKVHTFNTRPHADSSRTGTRSVPIRQGSDDEVNRVE